jgi:hypothetical protein
VHRKTLSRFNGMDPVRIGQFAEDTPAKPETPAAPDYTTFSDADLATAYSTAYERGQALAAKPAEELSAEEVTEFGALADTVSAINTERTTRQIKADHFQAQRDAFAAAPAPEAPKAPAAPVAAPVAAVEPVPAPEVPSVTAMAAAEPVAPPVPADAPKPGDTFAIELNPDAAAFLSKQPGEATDVRELTRASLGLFKQFGHAGGPGRGQVSRRALGQFKRTRDDSLVLPGTRDGDHAVIQHARDQKRLDKGSLMATWQNNASKLGAVESLTAAAGWCAPSENRYELCSLWDVDGIFDAPTTTAPRGGINYTSDFTWAQINDAAITSFRILTEAEVIADEEKPCAELPCPEFTDRRLDVAVTCITGQFLQAHAYPEVVSTWTDGLLTKHAYEINKNIIAQVVAFAGAANVIPGQNLDTSASASILAAIEVAAIDMRERSNMSFGQTLEVVLPRWVLAQFRADISRRNAWHADPFTLSDQQIISWFATRNVRPQFIRGWQDAQSGLAGGPGDITAPITPITALPTTVDFLIYPAGAVVVAREDVVTLTNVYDSTQLTTNRFTQLFTEEGFAPIFPCGEVRQYTAQACPSGATALQVDTSCVAP